MSRAFDGPVSAEPTAQELGLVRPPVILDFADAHRGNPVLDGLRLSSFLPGPGRSMVR
ncbi:hypothetical protein AB0D14_21910 [Streptomyces sp. NPDC048484]|uniref:hypothetical protein n=1 Tax=Streptomyces sp. NPDC048484 TaxID=3155146 RepID=UPI0034359C7C